MDPLYLENAQKTVEKPREAANLYGYVQGNPTNATDPSGLDSVFIVVGTDQSGGEHTLKNADSFVRRVDRLLHTNTVEGVSARLKANDRVYVVVPESMPSANVKLLQSYGAGIPNYQVVQTNAAGLTKLVNEQKDVRDVAFFGHGHNAPIYDYGVSWFPEAKSFEPKSFLPEARAVFATCNSADYAKSFTEALGVTSVGTEGTSFYGQQEISAGRLTPGSQAGTSRAWEYRKDASGKVTSQSHSLNQHSGTPYLREAP